VRVYALTSSYVPHETLDLFMSREAAEAELREILEDEPEWVTLYGRWGSSLTSFPHPST
jgi:hypothetical protein